ncbi:hypothetical protein OGAPHI_003322 [Ogataea philodendri]|uniref:Uncharacterized protein n=1 Tax=Ogataea philodendri TaxID=1378263 RepID=A0A9P8T5D2_9ASCO|nr:uncharacterized protein OGAPHI_003322 [Ogataea philodendri]KAH3666873.1 hypothetical protein OGAPHI_003322 [Ogataea philodendri]
MNSAQSAGLITESTGDSLSPSSTVEPAPFTGEGLAHTISDTNRLTRVQSPYTYPLSKAKTHQASGFYDHPKADNKPLPAYKTVHLDHVLSEFRPVEPRSIFDGEKKPVLIRSRSVVPARAAANYERRVSFDTVNLQVADEGQESSDDEFEYEMGMSFDRDRMNRRENLLNTGGWGPSAGQRSSSPGGNFAATRGRSPSREQSPGRNNQFNQMDRSMSPAATHYGRIGSVSPIRNLKISGVSSRRYPTTPIITHDACTLTKKHKDYDRLYSKHSGKRAALPDRNIMCYISGRKHTWVALDWCCNRLLEDGDTMVVTASINPNSKSLFARRLSSGSVYSKDVNWSESTIRNSPEYAKVVTENIMKYIMAILNPNKVLKITIELAVGGTKDVLKDMYSLYLPYLVVVAAKPTKAASTRSWVTSRVTDRLVKNFHVPVVIVPSLNMDLFEERLFRILNTRMEELEQGVDDPKMVKQLDQVGSYKLSDHRLAILADEQAEDSNAADSSVSNLRQLQHTTSVRIYNELAELLKHGNDKDKYKNWLKVVSSAAHSYGVNLAETAKSGGESAKLVRTLTGAPDPHYGRAKSMLLDPSPKPPPRSPHTPKIPTINIDSLGQNDQPRQPSSVKFDISHPKYGRFQSDTAVPMEPLRASRSTPQLSPQRSASQDKEKDRKGFFRNLFKRK